MPELGDFVILTEKQVIELAEFDQADKLRIVVIWADLAPEPLESLIFADAEVPNG